MLEANFRRVCIACDRMHPGRMNQEHFWPRWLIDRTGTHATGVKWLGRKVSPRRTTIPICESCNSEFGRELEAPVSQLFGDIENGRGLSDAEAELLVRWMWKFEGYAWKLNHLEGVYSTKCTLRERVVGPIYQLRGDIVLACPSSPRSILNMATPRWASTPSASTMPCSYRESLVVWR